MKNCSVKNKVLKTAARLGILLFLFVLLTAVVSAARQTAGNVTGIAETRPNGVVLTTSSGARVSVEFFDLNVIRVRLAPTGNFERDLSYAIDRSLDRKTPEVKVAQTGAEIVLSNAFGAKVVVQKAPLNIKILDESGEMVVGDDPRRPTSFDPETGEIETWKLRRSEVETYYGFGEKAFAEMSRNGKYIVNWNTDTFAYPIGTDPIYESIPFFYALYRGKTYGLFFNNTFRTFFDMGKTAPESYSFGSAGGELDYFVFTGGKERRPQKVLEDYANLTGKTPLPPIWALGNQQSRWSYFPESRVRTIAREFRRNRIPADVIYLDIDYMNGYRVFTWDRERFPDPAKLVADLKKDGFRTVLIIDPGIKQDNNYDVYQDGVKNDIFVKNPDGSILVRRVWPGDAVFPDFTDPKARQWFGSFYRRHLDEGIAGFWNDMNEPGVFLTEQSEKPEIFHHPAKTFPYDTPHAGDGLPDTHRRYHNVFGMQMARATFEGLRRLEPEKRPFVLTRAGFAGVQRYSAVWTGDNYASWDHLALSIPMLANLSVSGVPFIGCDVGGFAEMPSGELYARWLQAGALTPFFRSHSVGWVGDKEPWAFGAEFTAINRATVELRYQFLPYLYTVFREHERSGAPVMRPLWYEFPDDPQTHLINDQYLVGGDVLVAPVIREGAETRGIYLPVGADWIDWWTGEKLESGKTHYLKTPLERLPIFVRAGAVIPTQTVIQHTGEMANAQVTLNVIGEPAPGKTVMSKYYQDAGEGYDYRRSGWLEIRSEYGQNSLKIERIGDFKGQTIKAVEFVGPVENSSQIRIDGRAPEKTPTFDFQRRRTRVEIGDGTKEITFR
ncbi:MAG: glycoside hydrolase family 31 protein [Pyrinomonadaceae bacterium]